MPKKPHEIFIALTSCLVITLATAISHALTLKEYLDTGTNIDRIHSAHSLNTFSSLDRQYLLLTEGSKRIYLLNLGKSCYSLDWADKINISQSNDTIHAGFDYVSINGARCEIDAIRTISNNEFKSIRWSPKV
ncbi:MAG: hypothetical protein KUG75_11495 [Pseudomonadales bacterium]|nr:hypothetical protein [Pseudomonadales bacterium]